MRSVASPTWGLGFTFPLREPLIPAKMDSTTLQVLHPITKSPECDTKQTHEDRESGIFEAKIIAPLEVVPTYTEEITKTIMF